MRISSRLRLLFVPFIPLLLLVCPGLHPPALAQFPINPATNVPISVAFDSQTDPVIIDDGHGGAFVAWNDLRSGLGFDVYMQHLDARGTALWAKDGIPICTEAGIQDLVVMVPDGANGAILTWEDKRTDVNYDIYAQRVDSSGKILWAAGGIPVAAIDGDQQAPCMVSDGQGGAIIAWNDNRPNGLSGIYSQRIDGSGNPAWMAGGLPVLGASIASQFVPPVIIQDGNHGAIVGWDDWRSNTTNIDIYVQRISGAGESLWDTLGMWVCLDTANQGGVRLASDGAGGAIVAWTDWRAERKPNGILGDNGVYAQHVDSAGIAWWTKDGVKICDTLNTQTLDAIAPDGAGGAILAWEDTRASEDGDIYAQHVNSAGDLGWDPAGLPICNASGAQGNVRMVSDSLGGVFMAWTDNRVVDSYDLYAARISGKGSELWAPNGTAVSTALYGQLLGDMKFNTKSGLMLAWMDGRASVSTSDIYAQNIDPDGRLGLAPVLSSPANGTVIGTDSVRLAWRPLLPSPSRYWLELGLDSTFTFKSSDSTITDTSYLVKNLSGNHSYWWRIRGYDNGSGPLSEVRKFSVGTGVSGIEQNPDLPKVFSLGQNYPNPFNPTTGVRFQVPGVGGAGNGASGGGVNVTLIVYDMLGKEVAVLVNERKTPGIYEVTFDGSRLASGVYFYRMKAGNFVDTKKLVLLK